MEEQKLQNIEKLLEILIQMNRNILDEIKDARRSLN